MHLRARNNWSDLTETIRLEPGEFDGVLEREMAIEFS